MKKILLTLLCTLLPLLGWAQENEPYAVLSDNNTVLTFYYDGHKAERNGLSVGPFSWPDYQSWYAEREAITTVVFDASFAACTTLTSTVCWFYGCSNLATISGMENLKMDNVTNMGSMFEDCSGLTSLDLSSFKTDNVTDMGSMFRECSALTSLDLSSFNTSSVTDMGHMFSGCSSLTSLNVSSFNTSSVTSMGGMFSGCSTLTSIDLSNFNTSSVTSMSGMFSGCSTLTSIDLRNFNTSSVTSMSGMFSGCSTLTSIDLRNFNTGKVTEIGHLFFGCSSLTSIDLSSFKTDSMMNMLYMFNGCSALTSLDLSNFNTSNVMDMGGMFWDCSALTSLDLSNFNTSSVMDMSGMFWGCSALTSLDLSNFNTSSVTDMGHMLSGCSSLTSLNVSSFNTNNVTNMQGLFWVCNSLPSLDLSNFNTSNVTNMSSMFGGCSDLTTIYVGEGWNTSAVTNGDGVFNGCSNLIGGKGTKYHAAHEDYTYARIDQGPDSDAPGYLTRSGDAPWVEPETIEPYAVLSEDNTVLTFYYDGHKAERNGMNVGPFGYTDYQSWYAEREAITTVVFDASFAGCTTLTSTAYWFHGCNNLATISGMENLKTDNVTNMVSMFSGCSGLTSLDLSSFKTDNVTDMGGMFSGCSGLTSLDVSGFKTDNVTSMGFMFYSCSSLTSLDVSSFKTDNVTHMVGMFYSCSSLTSLDLSSFKTDNVTRMGSLFEGCSGLTSLDVSGFKTDNVTDMGFMFDGCSGLTSLDLSSFKTDNVTYMAAMFSYCSSLTSLDVSGFNTENVTDMGWMFYDCSGLTSLDLSSFNTENVTDMKYMFRDCEGLTTIYVDEGWSTSAVTSGDGMFTNCYNLVGGKGTKYNYIHDDYTYARIDQGSDSEAPGYFTRSGDIPWGEKSTFDGRVLTVRGSGSIDAALAQVGGFEQVDKTITAIVWEADVPYSGAAAFSNPNLLFYANDATKGQAINNLIYNGVAESITLTDEGEGNTDFYCPQSFTAQSITYRRSFQQQTEIGVSRGWETIALPFTVQRISRVRSGGEGRDNITPFGSSESTRHFWLRRLTANGLQSVQTIEANTPYIIAMPNSEEYAAEYNLAGDIVFTAENATVAVTEPVSDRSADYELTANFERMAAQDSIYVLNVGAPRYGYPEGSLFEAAYRDLQPFRAYTRHINNGRPAPPYFALGNLGGTTTTGISSVSDTFATDTWYDIQGRKLQGRPTQKGVYIHNGRKVIVK